MASLKHKKNVLTSILFEAIVELSGAILTCDWMQSGGNVLICEWRKTAARLNDAHQVPRHTTTHHGATVLLMWAGERNRRIQPYRDSVMDAIVWEQLEPVPVRQFKQGDKDFTEYAANFRFVKRLDNVRWKGMAWEEAKQLVAHPVLQFIGEE